MNFDEALKIERRKYLTPKQAHIRPSHAWLITMDGMAVTNAESTVPVIGTTALGVCAGLIAYNMKTQTAAITHVPHPSADTVHQLLASVRNDPSDQVQFHILGKPFVPGDRIMARSINSTVIQELTKVLTALEKAENVTLATFDVYNKPRPYAVAIDARNGKLIRGSNLFTTSREAEDAIVAHSEESENNRIAHSDLFHGYRMSGLSENFDGTLPELRRAPHH